MTEQMQQLRQELDARVLERAEADPQWRRRFAADPPTAVEDMPEAQRLREMDDPPPEAANVALTEEYLQLNQRLTEKVLDRAASDPQWKQLLLTDPEVAMREANFPEYQRLEEIRQEEAEVWGHEGNLMTLNPSVGVFSYYNGHPCRLY